MAFGVWQRKYLFLGWGLAGCEAGWRIDLVLSWVLLVVCVRGVDMVV